MKVGDLIRYTGGPSDENILGVIIEMNYIHVNHISDVRDVGHNYTTRVLWSGILGVTIESSEELEVLNEGW